MMNSDSFNRPFWAWVGLVITVVQLSIVASLVGMPMEAFESFLERHRWELEFMAWMNGFAALGVCVSLVVLTLHLAGVL